MIFLDYKDRRPIYEQIVERFQELILAKVLECGEKLPSVRNLAMELSINPNTIQRAYMELERQGFIYSIKGKGSFVADIQDMIDIRRREWEEHMEKLAQEVVHMGLDRKKFMELAEISYKKAEERK